MTFIKRVAIVGLVGASVGILAYFVSVEALAFSNRVKFAARPEVENWAMPYVDTTGPSLVVAVGVALVGVAVAMIVLAVTGDRREIFRAHSL